MRNQGLLTGSTSYKYNKCLKQSFMHFIFFRVQKVDRVYCAGMVVKNIETKESIHQDVTHLFVEDTRNIFSCAVYDDLFYAETTCG